jgi:Tfp pilus assembly protein PilV
MMIEVIISALIVGLIVIGTLSGFGDSGRATADERAQAQASVIAQQNEEQMRGMTTAQLGQLGSSAQTTVAENGVCVESVAGTWRYYTGATTSFCEKSASSSGTYHGTVFTIASSAQYVTASKETFTCETEHGTTDYIQTTSSVTWPALGSRKPASQSSLVSLPAGAGLEVKVKNQNEEPVAGATVTATGTSTKASQITPASGCVIFGALMDKTVAVDAYKSNWVDHNGKNPTPAKSVTVSPTSLSTEEFTIAEPGSILAEFVTQEGGKEVAVQGNTFVALQTGIATPDIFVGGVAESHQPSSQLSGLFPFVTPGKPSSGPNPYTVFAGDCEANNPKVVSGGAVEDRSAQVNPGGATSVKIEEPPLGGKIREGTKALPENAPSNIVAAEIINPECSSSSAQNYTKVPYEHNVEINSNGELSTTSKYQPYAKKLEFCVVAKIGSKEYRKYRSATPIENKTKTGGTIGEIYLKETSTGYSKSTTTALTCP